jgi:hypothetical protein
MIPLLSVGVHFGQSPFFLIGLVIVFWAFTIWVYRHTVPPVVSWKRTILKILRGLSLAVLLLLLWKPVLSIFIQHNDSPILAVLIDDSASMGLQESNNKRSDVVETILKNPVWSDLGERFDIRYFAFADSPQVLANRQFDSLAFNHTGTNLCNSWQLVESSLREGNYTAAVILSDGDNNAGENPVRLAQYSSVPLYTIGIGDSTPARDAMIVQTNTNDICYAGDEVPLDVRVRGVGVRGETSLVKLNGPNGEDLGVQTIHWKDDFLEETLRFKYIPPRAGTWKYQVSLEPLPNELTVNNNRKSFYVKVLESKVSVLVLAGSPNFDLEFLVKALKENPRINAIFRTQNSQGGYYEGTFPSVTDLDKVDLVLLHHYPSASTSLNDLQSVVNLVKRKECPIMFLMGPEVSLRKLDVISELLPFRTVYFSINTIDVQCSGSGSHVIFEDDEGKPWVKWEVLPPVWASSKFYEVKPGCQVIAVAFPQSGGETIPAMIVQKIGLKKSLAVMPWGLWKWGFQLSLDQSKTLDTFLDRSIRYLVTREEDKLVRISTSKPIYQGGETVNFSAQVYNEDYQPVDGAEVEVSVTKGAETVKLALESEGNGRYSGDLSAWTEGEYTYEGKATRGKILGEDQGKFTVEAFNIEFLNTSMNAPLLRMVAAQSGGAFASAQNFEPMLRQLHFPTRLRTASWEVPIWNRAWLLWVFIGLLSVEWVIRKRSGML